MNVKINIIISTQMTTDKSFLLDFHNNKRCQMDVKIIIISTQRITDKVQVSCESK